MNSFSLSNVGSVFSETAPAASFSSERQKIGGSTPNRRDTHG